MQLLCAPERTECAAQAAGKVTIDEGKAWGEGGEAKAPVDGAGGWRAHPKQVGSLGRRGGVDSLHESAHARVGGVGENGEERACWCRGGHEQ